MDTAVTVLSIECATLIIKAANRVIQIFEALQKREFGFLCVSLAILVPSEIERGQWTRDAKR